MAFLEYEGGFMKRIIIIILSICILFCTSCLRTEAPSYLSIAVTYYNDNATPENGMTTAVLKSSLEDPIISVGSVPYTSQYPLAVYDASEQTIYYSAVDESGSNDQLWKYDLKNRNAKKLTDSFFAINYIIPRENDVVVIAAAKKDRKCTPYLYDKNNQTLSKLEFDIDFNCSLCTYQATSGRLILSGTSYKQELEIREAWNSRKNQDDPYYPPDTYIYELSSEQPQLLVKLDRYLVRHIAIKNDTEIFYTGLSQKYADLPETQFLLKTGELPIEYKLFSDDFQVTIYDEFIFTSDNDIYFLGAGPDPEEYPQGLYHYIIDKDQLELIYDGSDINGYINNFIFLQDKI